MLTLKYINSYQDIVNCRTNKDFWDYMSDHDPQMICEIDIAFLDMKKAHPKMRLVFNPGDQVETNTLRCIMRACENHDEGDKFKERIIDSIERFAKSEPKKKDWLIDEMMTICMEKKKRGEDEKSFFLKLINKKLITQADCSRCIRRFREKGWIDYIPILILNENGYFERGDKT